MKIYEYPDLKWFGLAVFLATFILKISLAPTDYIGIGIIGVGLFCLVAILVHSYISLPDADIYWDENRGILAIIRFWSVETISARILASVPIGIDLSHSAKKVLQSMYTRFINEPGGELVFFITRPLGNESSKIGFIVRRRGFRFWNGLSRIEKLSKKLTTDTAILERAMRAAYPHLPVELASFEIICRVATGGLETHALA